MRNQLMDHIIKNLIKYLEMICAQQDGPSLPAKVGSARTGKVWLVYGWQGGAAAATAWSYFTTCCTYKINVINNMV